MEKIRIIQVVVIVLFPVAVYFLLPFILPVMGVKTYLVISNSMFHFPENQAFFESFYENIGVKPENLPLRYGLNKGDLVFITAQESYGLGDVVVVKVPGAQKSSVHRIYTMNSTHLRDVGDVCIAEENLQTTVLGVNDYIMIVVGTEKEDITPNIEEKYEKIYEGPYYELCSHYWFPISGIQGKVFLVLPQAGFFDLVAKGYPLDPPEDYPRYSGPHEG